LFASTGSLFRPIINAGTGQLETSPSNKKIHRFLKFGGFLLVSFQQSNGFGVVQTHLKRGEFMHPIEDPAGIQN